MEINWKLYIYIQSHYSHIRGGGPPPLVVNVWGREPAKARDDGSCCPRAKVVSCCRMFYCSASPPARPTAANRDRPLVRCCCILFRSQPKRFDCCLATLNRDGLALGADLLGRQNYLVATVVSPVRALCCMCPCVKITRKHVPCGLACIQYKCILYSR